MILVDSSVWIDFFRGGKFSDRLDELLELNLIITNDIILTEIIPSLRHSKQTEVIRLLEKFPKAELQVYWEGIRELQYLNLMNGLNKVGIPDLMIAQQCLDQNLELWTLDKHFSLMAQFTALKILEV